MINAIKELELTLESLQLAITARDRNAQHYHIDEANEELTTLSNQVKALEEDALILSDFHLKHGLAKDETYGGKVRLIIGRMERPETNTPQDKT